MDQQSSTTHDDEFDLAKLLRVLWQYKVLIVAVTLLVGVGTAVLALLTKPIYRASVVITEVRGSGMSGGLGSGLMSQLGGLASFAGVNLGGPDESRTAQAVLKSRHLAEEFVKRNDLLNALFKDSKSDKKPTLWKGVERFQGVVRISEDLRQGKTTVTMDWEDPALAARWANGFVGLANDILRTRARDEATRNIAYLNEQISKTNVLELQKVMYNLVENETKTLMLANARTEYAFAIVDPAVAPEVRISPKRTLMVITGLALGGFFSFILALGLDFWRRQRHTLVPLTSAS